MLSALKSWTPYQHLKKYTPLLQELVKRDLKVKYRRSVLGYLWSLLNPLLMMLVMTVVFSYMYRSGIDNFALYLICGQTMWNYFSESTRMAMDSIIVNGQLIKKVYIPKFIFPLSRVLSSFVTLIFSIAAIVLVMICTGARFYWQALLFPIPLLLLAMFSFGVSMVLSGLAVRFRDVMHLYNVLTLAWMYLTPIFYPLSFVPEKVQMFIKLNPMYHYINFFRQIVLYGNIPGINTWLGCIVPSLVSMVIGYFIFRKMQKDFILYL